MILVDDLAPPKEIDLEQGTHILLGTEQGYSASMGSPKTAILTSAIHCKKFILAITTQSHLLQEPYGKASSIFREFDSWPYNMFLPPH